jgi:hypothetical protein
VLGKREAEPARGAGDQNASVVQHANPDRPQAVALAGA